ncbi:MAG: hypothetical protein AB7S38_38075 [Vulcanimicrobiota bacterium]
MRPVTRPDPGSPPVFRTEVTSSSWKCPTGRAIDEELRASHAGQPKKSLSR